MTAWLMDAERPKSSALTINRRTCAASPSDAIVRRHRAGNQSPPGLEYEQSFLAFVQARQFRAEDGELLPLKFSQQSPINRAHQFSRGHRAAILRGQRLPPESTKIPRPPAPVATDSHDA